MLKFYKTSLLNSFELKSLQPLSKPSPCELIFLSHCSRLVARIMIENKTYCFSSNQNVGWEQRPCFSSFHFLSSSNFSFFSCLRPFDVKLVYTHTNKRISRSMSSSIMYNKNKLLLSDFFYTILWLHVWCLQKIVYV